MALHSVAQHGTAQHATPPCIVHHCAWYEGGQGMILVQSDYAHRHVLHGGINEQPKSRCKVMVLQGGLIVVDQGNWMCSLDQEVIVETSMLKVVHHSRPVASKVKAARKGIGLE